MLKNAFAFSLCFGLYFSGIAQIYNTDVEGVIDLDYQEDLLQVATSAYNKTEISQSLQYVFSIFRIDSITRKRTQIADSGRFVLQPRERQKLKSAIVDNLNGDRAILLLLIYDLDKNIIGQDRIVIDRLSDPVLRDDKSLKEVSEDIKTSASDGVTLQGVVIEDSKTKTGSDFYKIYYSSYLLNRINADKVVKISETFGLGMSTRIEVLVEDQIIFSFFARPNDIEFLKNMTDIAIRRTLNYFQNLRNQNATITRY